MSSTVDIKEYLSHASIFSDRAEMLEGKLPDCKEFLGIALIKQSGKIKDEDGNVKEVQLSYIVNMAGYWKIAGLVSEISPTDGSVVDQLFSYREDDSLNEVVSSLTKGAQRLGELSLSEPKFAFLTVPLKRSRPKATEELNAYKDDNIISKFFGEQVVQGLNSNSSSICDLSEGSSMNGLLSKFAESKSALQRYNRKVTEIEEAERQRLAAVNARIEHCGQQWASW